MMDRYDVMALVGLVLVGVGLWLVSIPLALVAVGGLLMVGAMLGARRKSAGSRNG
ncbi:MAG: hypothetical protein R6X32_06025 [Chloroflexota bacterium]